MTKRDEVLERLRQRITKAVDEAIAEINALTIEEVRAALFEEPAANDVREFVIKLPVPKTPTKHKGGRPTDAARILARLESGEPVSVQSIMQMLGRPEKSVHRSLALLNKRVTVSGAGVAAQVRKT